MEGNVDDREVSNLGVRAFTDIASALGDRMERAGAPSDAASHPGTARARRGAGLRCGDGRSDHGHVALVERLRLLGPEQVLSRGYSITLDAESGSVIRDASTVRSGQRLRTRLKAGEVTSRVEA